MKKTYTPAFKAQVVQELLKETKTITQRAAEHSVHPNVLREWKVTVLKGMAGLFEKPCVLICSETDAVPRSVSNRASGVENDYLNHTDGTPELDCR